MQQTSNSLGRRKVMLIAAMTLLVVGSTFAGTVAANYLAGRHYYGGWNYYPSRTYYYSHYYYKPQPTYQGYKHHYCVYYTATPRYVYYYNPVSKVYWGRYDVKEKGYSMLAEKDRKDDLKAIPETAFPKPGEMPPIPDSEDGEKMLPIDPATLPQAEAPKDAPVR
jgi:hypothetical protein